MSRVGELDQKIDFNRPIATPNGRGGKSVSLALIQPGVWCNVRPMSGGETERYDKLNSVGVSVFETRYRGDIKEDDRISYLGEDYNIRYIPQRGQRQLRSMFFAERGVTQ